VKDGWEDKIEELMQKAVKNLSEEELEILIKAILKEIGKLLRGDNDGNGRNKDR